MDPILITLLAVVALLAATIGIVVWRRSRAAEDEEYMHFNCPSCHRRLRYRPKQAGHQGACPRCRESFVFPGGANPSKAR